MVRNTRCARVGSNPTYSNLTFAGEGLRETCLASSQEKLGQFQPSAQSSDEVELPQNIRFVRTGRFGGVVYRCKSLLAMKDTRETDNERLRLRGFPRLY